MRDENNRNTIIFFVCAAIMLLAYQFFVADPQAKRVQAEEAARKAAVAAAPAGAGGMTAPGAAAVPQVISRQAALTASPRVPIETPSLKGSLNLRGARIDDLYLVDYRETLKKDSPPVELLRPEGAQYAWFADLGWTGANVPGLPNGGTVWTLANGSVLAPGQPVTLTYTNGQGLTFTRTIAVDADFMFTVTDSVANNGATAITLAPYGSIQRQGVPATVGKNGVVHEGGVGFFGGDRRLVKYKKWEKDGGVAARHSTGGWIGITDHYWLAAVIPGPAEQIDARYALGRTPSVNIFDANYVGQPRLIGPNQQVTATTRVFAGAKKVPLLKTYQEKLGIPHLDEAVDWGMFWFLTRPVFIVLSFLFEHVGNFGVAILLLTVIVRTLMFPLANKQYESMTKMKKVQPAMEELRAKFKDDPARQQQELMELYKREKVNPLAGCLPILVTIPVFFSLFKVLQVDLDMRHAPFVGFVKDLSAPDPTTIFNLFGLVPWDPGTAPFIGNLLAYGNPPGFLHIGILAILYGATTWLTTAMSPPAPDPTQQRMLQLMPLLFTFIMAQFPIGLLIYYTWSNMLTTLQQYIMMRRFKVDNPIDRIIGKFAGKPKTV